MCVPKEEGQDLNDDGDYDPIAVDQLVSQLALSKHSNH